MNFSDLIFSDHPLQDATMAKYTFENSWRISVVSGPKDSGLYGVIGEDTFEVGIYRPNGNMLEDVLPYQTPVQISTMMRLIDML